MQIKITLHHNFNYCKVSPKFELKVCIQDLRAVVQGDPGMVLPPQGYGSRDNLNHSPHCNIGNRSRLRSSKKETVTALSFLEKEKDWQREARFVRKEFDALTGDRASPAACSSLGQAARKCRRALTDLFQLHAHGGDAWNSNTRQNRRPLYLKHWELMVALKKCKRMENATLEKQGRGEVCPQRRCGLLRYLPLLLSLCHVHAATLQHSVLLLPPPSERDTGFLP